MMETYPYSVTDVPLGPAIVKQMTEVRVTDYVHETESDKLKQMGIEAQL